MWRMICTTAQGLRRHEQGGAARSLAIHQHGRERFAQGSFAESVVRDASWPVNVVRHEEQAGKAR